MFKQESRIRQRCYAEIELALRGGEQRYEEERNKLIAKQAEEMQNVMARHDFEHEKLFNVIVEQIFNPQNV